MPYTVADFNLHMSYSGGVCFFSFLVLLGSIVLTLLDNVAASYTFPERWQKRVFMVCSF